MPGEFFRPIEETQPATRDSIRNLNSILNTLSEKPPKNIDVDESAALFAQFGSTEQMKGTYAFYAIKGNEQRESQRIFIALAPKELHPVFELNNVHIGQLHVFEREDMGEQREWVQTKYTIYGDKVSKHRIFPEQAFGNSDETIVEKMKKQEKKERMDERYGFALMTEGEVMNLNAELGALIDYEK